MKPFYLLLAALLAPLPFYAQSFEGEIVYQVTFQSKLPNVSNDRLTNAMGDRSEYYVQNGNYKNVCNGTIFQWQLYRHDENRIYNKMAKANAVLWIDAATNQDTVYNASLVFNAATILGYSCDEVILACKSGVQRYFFSPKLGVDSRLFIRHRFGNYYAFVSKSNALPLKYVIDNDQLVMEGTAVLVKPGPLDPAIFTLPPGAMLSPMPQN
ncbi:hypothetical protein [Dinghuibacter silviterrae]|uniref:GLPGLI family protein n=1 Tax=Dinghuibacter silviterrae TaxID=1539049 RepID=A0A4R8DSA2_9BACT|nr:hypothetical protein [Dinghuibacter silviterrae]TDX00295.1 hypothetical protein EDB95_1314 [Dinghuibacter silviterrae]